MATSIPEGAIPAGDKPPEPRQDTGKVESQEERVFAGKYKSPDDLEAGYNALKQKLDEQGSELGSLRSENGSLKEQQEALSRAAKEREESALKAEPPTDYEQELANVAKKYDDGDISFKEALLETNSLTAQRVAAENEQKMQMMQQSLQESFQSTLADRDNQVVVDKFLEKHQDFNELQDSGAIASRMAQDPMLDELSAYYALKADMAFEEGKRSHEQLVDGSKAAKRVLSDPGAAMQSQTKMPTTVAERKASMLAAIGSNRS